VVQLLGEAADPINYARLWLGPWEGGSPKHVFITEGISDPLTPALTTEALAAAGGIPIAAPVASPSLAHELLGMPNPAPPIAANVVAADGQAMTAVLVQQAGGHHVAFSAGPASMWQSFVATFPGSDPPRIEP